MGTIRLDGIGLAADCRAWLVLPNGRRVEVTNLRGTLIGEAAELLAEGTFYGVRLEMERAGLEPMATVAPAPFIVDEVPKAPILQIGEVETDPPLDKLNR